MGPAEIITTVVTASATKAAVGGLLEVVYEEAAKLVGAHARSAFKRWKTDRTARSVYERSKQIRKVKTIWQVEEELDLLEFYYPLRIKTKGEAPRQVHRLEDFGFDGNLVVRGIAGQGKSTFLRYLTVCELLIGERIPVFVELRRLGATQSIVEAVIEEMKNLGLDGADSDIIEYLGKASRLALLLDGFDEVTEERASELVQELENLAVRIPALRVVVTSRAENAIERSPYFRVFDLAPLGPGEFAKVVARIASDARLAEEIVYGVKRSHESIASLLTTPLMVALLVVRYRVGQSIPENRIAFYEPLFMLLLQRHDGAKAGFRRRRRSPLSDAELMSFFCCLCFITRRDGVSVLRESALNGAAARSLKWLNHANVPPDLVVEDIRKITCLILRDGDENRFLHKSVQEFYAACFVRDQPDALAKGASTNWGTDSSVIRSRSSTLHESGSVVT